MKIVKPFYYIGATISLLFGIWHFFVPYLFDWFFYIPPYENLVVGIEYTNFFFSLLLTGLSLLLIVLGKRFFQGNKDITIFYGLLVFTWFCRAAITLIIPWPLEPIRWAAHAQQIAAFAVFVFLLIPFIFQISSYFKSSQTERAAKKDHAK
jgi:hypothetical protein